jgi:hypothetical protein
MAKVSVIIQRYMAVDLSPTKAHHHHHHHGQFISAASKQKA